MVAGAGAMGAGIAQIMARDTGARLTLVDPDESRLVEAEKRIIRWFEKDSLKKEPAGSAADITYLTSFDKAEGSFDLLLEAASENISIKESVFKKFNDLAAAEAVIASNTSSLSITTLASFVAEENRKNVLGLHFFNPPRIMSLLEIITTVHTEPAALARAEYLSEILAKKHVVCKDAPGFITSRLGIVMVNEAIFALQEGLASAEDIDRAIKLGYNHPMGPLKLADFIGLDVVFAVTQTLYENYQDTKYRPPIMLRKMVEAGHLGQKTGRGFYSYDTER